MSYLCSMFNLLVKKAYFYFTIMFFGVFSTNAQMVPIRMMSYNLLNFPNGGPTCTNSINRADTLKKITHFILPDILGVCEIQTEAGADSVLNRALNTIPGKTFARAPWLPSGGSTIHNMLFYNVDKFGLTQSRSISTNGRDLNRYTLYLLDPNLITHLDTIFIEIFVCHFKAGSAPAEVAQRADQTAVLRDVIENLPPNRHYWVCGDFNTYRSSEQGYQNLLENGLNALKDPINSPGNWTGNSSFASIHTQSPRTAGGLDCGVPGGMDDRFDFILTSNNSLFGTNGIQYTANSYKAIGNDGNHFNTSITSSPTNTSAPAQVIRALLNMSDHLPVQADFTASLPNSNGLALSYTTNGVPCNGSGTSVTVSASFGQAPYTYLWDTNADSQTTQTAIGLSAGSYCVTVTDNLGQTDNVCFYLEQAAPFEVSVFGNASSSSCDGSAFVVVSGGISPYTYLWNDPTASTSSSLNGLCAGTYTCVVTDASGCSVQTEALVQLTSSVQEYNVNTLKNIYPNPASEIIFIENKEHADLWIFNKLGQVIFSGTGQINDFDFSVIDITNFEAGIYFIKSQVDGSIQYSRFVVKN